MQERSNKGRLIPMGPEDWPEGLGQRRHKLE